VGYGAIFLQIDTLLSGENNLISTRLLSCGIVTLARHNKPGSVVEVRCWDITRR